MVETRSHTLLPLRLSSWEFLTANKLLIIPPCDMPVCSAIARGYDSSATPAPQCYHPNDLPVLSVIDDDFTTAASLSFYLMLRAGQLDLLLCGDLDISTESIWCPPHKQNKFPYLRKPTPEVWQMLQRLQGGRPQEAKLFKRTSREYSALLGELTEAKTRITWHALRRGGVTTRAHAGQSADAIRRFGCWTSEKAVAHYIFPWSDVPLRCWRAGPATSTPAASPGGPAAQPHPKRRRQPARANDGNSGRHGRLRT